MTARAETPLDYDSDDTETISLADTANSSGDSDEGKAWDLDCILADGPLDEVQDDGSVLEVRQFLIKWTGYSVYRSTWQSEADLQEDAPETLRLWQEEKMRADRGFKELFDVDSWREELHERVAKRKRRHDRRNRRRKKLGLPVVEYQASLYYEEGDSASGSEDEAIGADPSQSSSDDEPLASRELNPSRKPNALNESSGDENLQATRKRKRRTAAEVERELQQMRAIQKKKGRAVPVDRNPPSAKTMPKLAARPTQKQASTAVRPPATVTAQAVKPVTTSGMTSSATGVVASIQAGPKKVISQFGGMWSAAFGSRPSLQVNTSQKSATSDNAIGRTPVSGVSEARAAPTARMY